MNANADYFARLVDRLFAVPAFPLEAERDQDIAGGDYSAFWSVRDFSDFPTLGRKVGGRHAATADDDGMGREYFLAVQQQNDGPVTVTIEARDMEGEPVGSRIQLTDPHENTLTAVIETTADTFARYLTF